MHSKKLWNTSSVGVVIPYYNQKSLLKRSLDCVVSQTAIPDAVIVVDDYSHESVISVVSQYETLLPIRYVKMDRNLGPSAARNRGVELLNVDYILFLDADDIWEFNHIETILTVLEKDKKQFLATSYSYFSKKKFIPTVSPNARKNIEKIDDLFELLCSVRLPFVTSSTCVSKDLFVSLGGFDESLRLGEDQVFWLKAWLSTNIFLIPKLTVKYTLDSPFSLTKTTNSKDMFDYLSKVEGLFDFCELDSCSYSYKKYLSRNFFRACIASCSEGDDSFNYMFERRKRFYVSENIFYSMLLCLLSKLGLNGRVRFSYFLLFLVSCVRFLK